MASKRASLPWTASACDDDLTDDEDDFYDISRYQHDERATLAAVRRTLNMHYFTGLALCIVFHFVGTGSAA